MHRKRLTALSLALLLTMCFLLSGCRHILPEVQTDTSSTEVETLHSEPRQTEATTPAGTTVSTSSVSTEVPAVTESTPAEDEYLIRWQNGGQMDFLPDKPIELVRFSEMPYVHPDTEALFSDFDALAEQALESTKANSLLDSYYDLYRRYISFYSMESLANVRYALDTSDDWYRDEFNFCQELAPNLEEKLEALYKAFAASPSRRKLEQRYFGRGFFSTYDDYAIYTNEEVLRLSQQEAALLTQYRELTASVEVTYRNETKPLNEWLQTDSYTVYYGVINAYLKQYHEQIGSLFIELVKVRQQLAKVLEYEDYTSYSYDFLYQRDYTPEDGSVFLEGIRTQIVPLVKEIYRKHPEFYDLTYPDADAQAVMQMVQSAAEKLGGTIWDAFRFMTAYELCDIAPSTKKLDASFETYFYDYEAPFVFVNASGSGEDYQTFSHEFGHFAEAYYNYGAESDYETAETFSQAMEFLTLLYTETLSKRERSSLLKLSLLDILDTFAGQGAYADFEAQVYALDPEELTLEAIDDIYLKCNQDYGVYMPNYETYYKQGWINVLHFFEVPNYVISYCVSAQTSLQICAMELEHARGGADAYFRMLDRPYGAGLQQILEEAELDSPFDEAALKKSAAFIKKCLED